MASCVLTEGKYNLLCLHTIKGEDSAIKKLLEDVCQEQDAIVTLETFSKCAHMYNKTTPLVLAAQHGHISIVMYLVNLVPQEPFINNVSTVYDIANVGDELHHVTALNAACIRGHLSIVKFLVEQNASLCIPDCTGSSPLCEAVFHGRLDIVDYLCEQGADVHAANDFGWQPIHIAALQDNCLAYECLVKHNADVCQCTPEGYSPLHIAAQNGSVKILTQIMNSSQAVETSQYANTLVSSPLMLASAYCNVSLNHQKVVNKLSQLPDCTQHNKCDSYYLMGVSYLNYGEYSKAFSQWQKAVAIVEEQNLYFSSVMINGRKEIRSFKELSEMCDLQNPLVKVEMWYQAIIIWENRIGFCDLTYWDILHKAVEKISSKPDQEMLLLRGMKMADQYLLPRLSNGFILPEIFEQFFDLWVRNSFINSMKCKFETTVLLSDFVAYLLKTAKVISLRFNSLSSTYGCKRRSPLKILSTILIVFDIWLKSDFSTEIDPFKLGVEFVESFLMLNDNNYLSILHYIIKKKLYGDFAIVDFLVQCGAGRSLNMRCEGNTCLHLACMSGDLEVVAFLCDIGAHIDAVDEKGFTPLERLKKSHPNKVSEFVSRYCSSPLPLQCLSVAAVLEHAVYFDDLPQAVRDFITLHCGE